ncbi:MAG: response regulator transcription factor [Deltaproteobacteria bacterium]|jgi:DNA-binding NarL/FixJ family response regulator|nr:response regulator transcription factor [Deltaproteobacteria bacterium]
MSVLRVIIADDHAIVRSGLRELLSQEEGLTVVAEAADGREALRAAAQVEADVLVLDLSLPKVSGHEVLRRLTKDHPSLAVVVFTMMPPEQYAARMAADGAAAFVHKGQPLDALIRAVRAVGAGQRPSLELDAPARPARVEAGAAPHDALTRREHQVFLRLVQGEAVSDIAAELDLSVSTVSTYVGAIKAKLSVRSVAEMVRYAVREGLVEG